MAATETAVKRRSKRIAIPDVRVEVTREGEAQPSWMCSAIDLNGDGMALTLPPELEPGTRLRLSFQPDPALAFHSVPCVVKRQDVAAGYGAVEFAGWSEESLIELWAYLVERS